MRTELPDRRTLPSRTFPTCSLRAMVGKSSDLSLKEKDEVVFQALGWLAREDKIDYTVKNRRTFVSLVEAELRSFNAVVYNIREEITSGSGSGNGKAKSRSKSATPAGGR